jgi:DNA-binding NarL/FixJ family response regulator
MSAKKSILIVEDEALIAEDLMDIIISLGYDVVGMADNSAAAIALVKEKSPDLVTMDINLSGPVDGISTVELIRKVSDIPVIYITVFTTDLILERAKKTKPSGYIIKPFNARHIRTSIEIALHNYELERKVAEGNTMIRTIVNATANPLMLIDTSGTIQTANEAMAKRARRTFEQIQGIHIHQLVESGLITVQLENGVRKALEGTNVSFEESIQNSWYDNLCIPVKDASGKISQVAVFCNDVTFRKMAEEQLRILNERLITERNILTRAQEELRSLNVQLGEKVKERTAQLEVSNMGLIEQNRTLRISNAGTRALISVHDEAGFIPQICNDLVKSGSYSHVWLAGLDVDGNIGIVAAAGEGCPEFSKKFSNSWVPVCAEPVLRDGNMRPVTTLNAGCASCPLSLLHMTSSTIIVRLDSGKKPVALMGITLRPGIFPEGHETVRIWQIAQEIAIVILYIRTKENEEKAYRQITKNLEQLAILNDHIRNPLQGIIGYASLGEGELFEKIIKLSNSIDSIVTELDDGYLESKKIHNFLILHGEIGSSGNKRMPPRK